MMQAQEQPLTPRMMKLLSKHFDAQVISDTTRDDTNRYLAGDPLCDDVNRVLKAILDTGRVDVPQDAVQTIITLHGLQHMNEYRMEQFLELFNEQQGLLADLHAFLQGLPGAEAQRLRRSMDLISERSKSVCHHLGFQFEFQDETDQPIRGTVSPQA